MTHWLTPAEIDDLCEPLTQHAAQIRHLKKLGLTVKVKPSGAPLILRSHFESVMQPAKKRIPTKTAPDSKGLLLAFSRTGG